MKELETSYPSVLPIKHNGYWKEEQGYSILGAKRKVDIVYNIIPGRPKYF